MVVSDTPPLFYGISFIGIIGFLAADCSLTRGKDLTIKKRGTGAQGTRA